MRWPTHPSNLYVNNPVLTFFEIIPLIELLQKPNVTQKWYADDESAAGDLKNLRAILENLDVNGKAFEYNVKPPKCQFIVETSDSKGQLKYSKAQILQR